MLNQNFLDEITKSFKIKGKKILKVSCVVQLFPEDGALMLQMPVRDDLSVGAILEPDKDDYRNVWLLIPVTSSYGSSAKPIADLSIIQQYLEEFVICCKACFEAYKKRSSTYTLFNCASKNEYISNNFYQAYMALQSQWEVECIKVTSNHRECVIHVLDTIPFRKRTSNFDTVANNYTEEQKTNYDCNNKDLKANKKTIIDYVEDLVWVFILGWLMVFIMFLTGTVFLFWGSGDLSWESFRFAIIFSSFIGLPFGIGMTIHVLKEELSSIN